LCPAGTGRHSKTLTLLRWSIAAVFWQNISRQVGQNFEGSHQPLGLFTQYDLVASTKNFYFRALQPIFFRQPHGLTVTGTKNTGRSHVGLSHVSIYIDVYTHVRRQMQLPSQASPNRCQQFAHVEKCNLPDEPSPAAASAGKRHRLNCHNRMVLRSETGPVE